MTIITIRKYLEILLTIYMKKYELKNKMGPLCKMCTCPTISGSCFLAFPSYILEANGSDN